MSIKEMFHELINKKWTGEDLWTIVLSIVCASFLTTPILGIPIGIAVYFLFFYKQEDWDKAFKHNDYFDKKEK
ncbi:VraH family peptide resistance protein [Staphylococcus caprae]|uniref:VraH family peptide resistance protein n=1 Tax=Staphylococcus caprae TaxID=29380 RepID=UPI000E68F370|nr:hypothetical protein [Staphylococcus caprae]MBU5272675.1 VraH family protein [Staphylococcus caprae]RIM35469.1 hypothetical protein BU631_03120 [Staphylococcus caprae]